MIVRCGCPVHMGKTVYFLHLPFSLSAPSLFICVSVSVCLPLCVCLSVSPLSLYSLSLINFELKMSFKGPPIRDLMCCPLHWEMLELLKVGLLLLLYATREEVFSIRPHCEDLNYNKVTQPRASETVSQHKPFNPHKLFISSTSLQWQRAKTAPPPSSSSICPGRLLPIWSLLFRRYCSCFHWFIQPAITHQLCYPFSRLAISLPKINLLFRTRRIYHSPD